LTRFHVQSPTLKIDPLVTIRFYFYNMELSARSGPFFESQAPGKDIGESGVSADTFCPFLAKEEKPIISPSAVSSVASAVDEWRSSEDGSVGVKYFEEAIGDASPKGP
jgi:hypothetical protein